MGANFLGRKGSMPLVREMVLPPPGAGKIGELFEEFRWLCFHADTVFEKNWSELQVERKINREKAVWETLQLEEVDSDESSSVCSGNSCCSADSEVFNEKLFGSLVLEYYRLVPTNPKAVFPLGKPFADTVVQLLRFRRQNWQPWPNQTYTVDAQLQDVDDFVLQYALETVIEQRLELPDLVPWAPEFVEGRLRAKAEDLRELLATGPSPAFSLTEFKFGSWSWLVLDRTSSDLGFRQMDLIDSKDGRIFLADSRSGFWGWLDFPGLSRDWAPYSRLPVYQEPVVEEELDELPMITYGGNHSKVEIRVDSQSKEFPGGVHFCEYHNGKLFLEGEHDAEGQARPVLKLSNARHGNHTAVGYKAAASGQTAVIIKLGLLPESKLSSEVRNGAKHRTDKAVVLAIARLAVNAKGETEFIFDLPSAHSFYDEKFKYPLGEIVQESAYDGNSNKECSSGIHFFFHFASALSYHYLEQRAVERESSENMHGAVYHPANPKSYLYIPVSEEVEKIQRWWRRVSALRKAGHSPNLFVRRQRVAVPLPAAAEPLLLGLRRRHGEEETEPLLPETRKDK